MKSTLWKIAGMKGDGDLAPCLFIPENLVAAFCPDQHETFPFED